jgi:formaldehyde-activating enzyme involved in methanogenesis
MFFAQRMMALDPENAAKYADAIELEMYNGMLSGVSLDGDKFFYENPLEIYLEERHRIDMLNYSERWPITQRPKVFGCSCCPPNIVRLLSSMGNYMYSFDEKSGEVYINQFADSVYENDGARVEVSTRYPYDSTLKIKTNVPVRVRIPEWCHGFGTNKDHTVVGSYACFEAGEFEVKLTMSPELVASSVNVVRNLGKAALRYGPIIFCAEAVDNKDGVHKLYLDPEKVADAKISYSEELGRDCDDAERILRVLYKTFKEMISHRTSPETTPERFIQVYKQQLSKVYESFAGAEIVCRAGSECAAHFTQLVNWLQAADVFYTISDDMPMDETGKVLINSVFDYNRPSSKVKSVLNSIKNRSKKVTTPAEEAKV